MRTSPRPRARPHDGMRKKAGPTAKEAGPDALGWAPLPDAAMAYILLHLWQRVCPGRRAVCIIPFVRCVQGWISVRSWTARR